jgi:GTP-binding protein EngB required for normal cell division
MDGNYINALTKSKVVAQEEYRFVKDNLITTNELVSGLKQQIFKVVNQGESVHGNKDVSLQKLHEVSRSLNHDLDSAMLKHNQSIAKRAKKLEIFTVMLFGRTMAGKSTIREAITGGDGSTIGKGAQRTTRDIKEYEWQNLRIVDTPGFGAWGGEEDTAIAHSIVEESDLILFLLSSDSVQLSTIQEMKGLSAKNKPVIFVLNVKQDLTKKIHRKRFLKDPERFFSEDKIGGHIKRLEKLAIDELGLRSNRIKIIPLHAQAAYLAGQESNPAEAELLYKASRLPELFALLSSEISTNGPVRRIQSLLDGAYSHLDFLDQHLIENQKQLKVYSNTVDEKIKQFELWFNNYQEELPSLIDRRVEGVFSSFKQTIGFFVDDNIEREDFDKRWKKHLNTSGVESGLQNIMASLQEDVKLKVEQFNREVKQDIEFSRNFNFDNQNTYDPLDYKRLTGWGGAIASGIASIAFLNSWNPFGWTLVAVATIFGIFNYFSDSREKKLRNQKTKVAKDIRASIDKQKKSSQKEVLNWFDKNIRSRVINGLLTDTRQLVKGVSQLCNSLEQGSQQCNILLCSVNRRLIQQSSLAVSDQKTPDINNIVRIPGEGCFFTVNGYFRNPELLKQVGQSLNELVTVVYDSTPENMISHALGINKVSGSKVEIINQQSTVYVPKAFIGRVIGRGGWRIKLVTALLNIRINVMASN